jgi:hypothetical protein
MFGLGINKLGTPRDQALPEPETLLFANDEEGTFLDFTTTQVYADTAGTDPAEVGEGIAFVVDKSQGGIWEPRINFLTFTEEFDNAAWTKSDVTVSLDAIAAPDGTTTADKFVENTDTIYHRIASELTPVTSGTDYTFSIYAKGTDRFFTFNSNSLRFGTEDFAIFDLSSGTVTQAGTDATATISSAGNGWFRCVVTITCLSSGSASAFWGLSNTSTGGRSPSYTGDGTSGIYIWHPQLETGSTAHPLPRDHHRHQR